MRFVDRSIVVAPISLTDADGLGAKELEKVRKYYEPPATPSKAYKFAAYKGGDVRQALRALFHGKCAYCESAFEATQPVDVEHYRPKGQVEDSPGHPGYWWIAMRWENLLPSCIDCNRRRGQTTAVPGMSLSELEEAFVRGEELSSGKKDAFPTLNQIWAQAEMDPEEVEQPLLIDPTRIDPGQHIGWPVDVELSVAVPVGDEPSRIGEASIHVYGLNRIGLTEARTKVLRDLRVRRERIRDLLNLTADPNLPQPFRESIISAAQKQVRDVEALADPQQPYSALAAAFVQRLRAELLAES